MVDNAPKYVIEISGWDGTKVRSFSGEPSIRKLEFDSDIFQITEVLTPGPPKLVLSLRPEISAALAGIATDGTLVVDKLDVGTIIAKGNGGDLSVPDLSIVTKKPTIGQYDEVVRFVARGLMGSGPGVSFFGVNAVRWQTWTPGGTADDLADILVDYGVVTT